MGAQVWYPGAQWDLLPETCWGKELRNTDGIILHHISAVNVQPGDPYDYGAIREIFIDNRVSAHFLVQRDGSIVQLVPLSHEAWHAGRSTLAGRDYCNKFCFGVELVATPSDVFTGAQYDSAAQLCAWLCDEFGISPLMISRHRDVRAEWNKRHALKAAPAKFDPNSNWDMEKFFSKLGGIVL